MAFWVMWPAPVRRALGALPSQDLVARGGVAKGALIAGQARGYGAGVHRQSTSHAHIRMHVTCRMSD